MRDVWQITVKKESFKNIKVHFNRLSSCQRYIGTLVFNQGPLKNRQSSTYLYYIFLNSDLLQFLYKLSNSRGKVTSENLIGLAIPRKINENKGSQLVRGPLHTEKNGILRDRQILCMFYKPDIYLKTLTEDQTLLVDF